MAGGEVDQRPDIVLIDGGGQPLGEVRAEVGAEHGGVGRAGIDHHPTVRAEAEGEEGGAHAAAAIRVGRHPGGATGAALPRAARRSTVPSGTQLGLTPCDRTYYILYNEVPMALVHKQLQRIGNSTGVVLPPEILLDAGIQRGDEILIVAERGRIVISPRTPIREEVVQAAETVIARYDDVFQKLAR